MLPVPKEDFLHEKESFRIDCTKIPPADVLGVTVILLICEFKVELAFMFDFKLFCCRSKNSFAWVTT